MQRNPAAIAALERAGFDTQAGIAAVGGEVSFYLELLGDFRVQYLDRIASVRHEADAAVLERFAHDLKAVLRMLGESRIAQMTEAWEASLRNHSSRVEQQAAICNALDSLAEAFRGLGPAPHA